MITTISNETHQQQQKRITQQQLKQQHNQWSYVDDGDFGPSKWPLLYPSASGKHQSPIDIKSHFTIYDIQLSVNPLRINYENLDFCHFQNPGFMFQISSSIDDSEVSGGPARNSAYRFLQFHAHWGSTNYGSEHTIDGEQYAAEIHFVNMKKKFNDFNDACNSHEPDSLLVLGILVELGEPNPEFDKILKGLEEVKLKNQCYTMKNTINVKNLFPENISNYWTYNGSLTNPPCLEIVKWIVFQNRVTISQEQLDGLRELHSCIEESDCCNETRINCNSRPVCPLNERIVCRSFQ